MIQTRVNDLNLSYLIVPDDGLNTWLDSAMKARHDIVVEICEGFGADLGPCPHKEDVKTQYDVKDSTSGLPTNKTNDSLMRGLLVFAKYAAGIAAGASPAKWQQAVIDVANWYVRNVTSYMQNMATYCPLTGKKTRWDCSGFVTCCLQRYGILLDYDYQPTSSLYTNDAKLAKQLEEAGFRKYDFSWDNVQPFDIMTYAGHIEIYAGQVNGRHTSYAWGSYHPSLPCFSAARRRGYDVIWRCESRGKININFGKQMNANLTPTDTGISSGMIDFICRQETSHPFGYKMSSKDLNGYDLKDAHGHLTYGYGLLYHPNGKYMDSIKRIWTQQELESLYLQTIKNMAAQVDNWAAKNHISLLQQQKDAICSACFNFGPSGFFKKSVCQMIINNPNDPKIPETWAHLSDSQAAKYPGLPKRRAAEARWYATGQA